MPLIRSGPRQSVRRAVYAGFGAALVILGAGGALAMRSVAELAAARDEVTRVAAPPAHAAEALERTVLRRAVAVRNLVLTGDARHREAHDRELERGRELLGALARATLDPDGQVALHAVEDASRAYVAEADAYLGAVAYAAGAYDIPAVERHLAASERQLAAARERLLSRVQALSALQRDRERAARARAEALEQALPGTLLAAALALALALVASAFVTARVLGRRTLRLADAVAAAERGDLAPALVLGPGRGPPSRGELGRLGDALARLADGIRRREALFAAERRIGAALATALDPRAIAASTLAELAAHVRAAIGAVYVLEGEALVRAAGHGGPDVLPREGIVAQALARGEPVRLGAIAADLPFTVGAGFGEVRPRSVVAVPLTCRGERVGLLLLGSLDLLDEEALSLAERVGGTLALALQNALAHRRLGDLAAELRGDVERDRREAAHRVRLSPPAPAARHPGRP